MSAISKINNKKTNPNRPFPGKPPGAKPGKPPGFGGGGVSPGFPGLPGKPPIVGGGGGVSPGFPGIGGGGISPGKPGKPPGIGGGGIIKPGGPDWVDKPGFPGLPGNIRPTESVALSPESTRPEAAVNGNLLKGLSENFGS